MGKQEEISKHRIEALTDGIFAFAMTLLVLSINLPMSNSALNGQTLTHYMDGQSDRFINYAMSFMLLAVFWISHHRQFHHIKFLDWTLIWANVILLMFIALIPFTTALMNEFPQDKIADIAFGANMFVIAMLYYFIWDYATKGRRLVDKGLDDAQIERGKKSTLLIAGVALLASALCFIAPGWSNLTYLLIPVLLYVKLPSRP